MYYDLDKFRFKVNFKNLTDEEYEFRGFGSDSVIPANEAAVYFSADFSFAVDRRSRW